MKTILVATDFSDPANNAVDYAAHLAKQTGAELILFNVFKLNIHASNSLASNSSIEKLIDKNEDQLTELAEELEEKYQIRARWELRKNDAIDSLKEYMDSHSVDLVVMGIESNLTEYKLFGNTTTAAIKLMQFPLLVVPNDIHFEGIKKIMYACEASYLKAESELPFLKQFVRSFNAQLDIFHVLTSDTESGRNEEMEQMIDKILHDVPHNFRYVNN